MKRAAWWVMAGLSFGVVGYALVTYLFFPIGVVLHAQMRASFESQPAVVYAHIFGSAVALALGPFQFWGRLRRERPALHRTLGRTYLIAGVAVGGSAGLAMAASAYGGLLSALGFAGLALAWLYTGMHAYGEARNRNVAAHRRWMVRNFALTFAAVTLRLWLPGSQVAGIPFDSAYPAIAWLCWVPNLLLAELWLAGVFHRPGRRLA